MMSVNLVFQGMMDMELNEKERMLVHLAINSVISGGDADEMMRTIYHVRKHRCRHMENDEVKELIRAIFQEITLSKAMWEEP